MTKLLIAILILFFNDSFCQNLSNPHGTLVHAIICEDGILLAADSRASWYYVDSSSGNLNTYAHTDSIKKIYSLGAFKIGISGFTILNNQRLEDIVDKFNKKNKPDSSIFETFKKFHFFINTKLNIPDSIFTRNQYVLAGYENNSPIVLTIDKGGKEIVMRKIGNRIYTDDIASRYKYELQEPLTCNYVKPLVDIMFDNCALEKKDIGTPINIIKINSDNSVTDLNAFKFRKYKNQKEFFKAILNGKVYIEYDYLFSKGWLFKTLKKGISEYKRR